MKKVLGGGIWFLVLGILFVGTVLSQDKKPTGGNESKPAEIDLDKSFKKLFPDYENKPKAEAIFIDDKTLEKKCDYEANKGCRVYPVKKKNELIGFALIWQSDGFKGPIKIMLGLTQEGDITGLDILSHQETPQLGGKITGEEFQTQFLKKNLKNTKWMIEKEGGDIRAITGASFSSKAVVAGVKEALEFYEKHKEELKKKCKV